jgi:hypothetical protein
LAALGIGDDQYPPRWASLNYNPELGGYQVPDFSSDRLQGAPHYSRNETWDWETQNAPDASTTIAASVSC